ncbi:MAG: hypothetical protein QTN59_17240 [Candidatus Electrothrix communis]|nr:hypothetical protein [Desulfobulbus sp. US4]WLE96414.1 MAG: hypothetical protein QTN59_17240 [Candidatus Electrothrix communis]
MGTARLGTIFLTGQSDKHSCSLTPDQQKTAHELRKLGVEVQPLNFPYQERMAPYRKINILLASMANLQMFFQSRRPEFTSKYRSRFCEKISEYALTLVLAGSCGLEIINNLRLPDDVKKKLHIFSYGPVARKMPDISCTLVQGRHDGLSKYFFSKVDFSVNCGHMGYLQSPEVMRVLHDTALKLQRKVKE